MSEKITLPRTGGAPVTFTGELLVEVGGRHQFGRDHNRYHELALYRRDNGSYVLSYVLYTAYRTHWQGEADLDWIGLHADLASVEKALREYDPTANVIGYPAGDGYGDRFAQKQARLLTDIKQRYDCQVSELLAGMPVDLDGISPDRAMIAESRAGIARGEGDRLTGFTCPRCGGWAFGRDEDAEGRYHCNSDVSGRPLSLPHAGKACGWIGTEGGAT